MLTLDYRQSPIERSTANMEAAGDKGTVSVQMHGHILYGNQIFVRLTVVQGSHKTPGESLDGNEVWPILQLTGLKITRRLRYFSKGNMGFSSLK